MTSDLIEHFKLDAQVHDGHTVHIEPARGMRRAPIEQIWYREKFLGHGAFGEVWLEAQRDKGQGATRAVKLIQKSRMQTVKIDYKRELLALAKLSRYPELFVTLQAWYENDSNIFLAMEYFPHGDLDAYIQAGVSEDGAKLICGQLLDGLSLMHQIGFTHRDLKPQNIFVASPGPHWGVKIGDFGISKRIATEQTALRTLAGTQQFQAPEILGYVEEAEETSEYTNAVDMWSLGCVTYLLLTKTVPFARPRTLSEFCSGRVHFPNAILQDKGISSEGIQFVEALLNPHPARRLLADTASQHPWLDFSSAIQSGLDLGQHDIPEPQVTGLLYEDPVSAQQGVPPVRTAAGAQATEPRDQGSSLGQPGTSRVHNSLGAEHTTSFYRSTSHEETSNHLMPIGNFTAWTGPSREFNDSLPRGPTPKQNYNLLPFSGPTYTQNHHKAGELALQQVSVVPALESPMQPAGFSENIPHQNRSELENVEDVDSIKARESQFISYVQEGTPEDLESLVATSGVNIDLRSGDGRTALHIAVLDSRCDNAQWLLLNGANISATDYLGKNALHLACTVGYLPMVVMLWDSRWHDPALTKVRDLTVTGATPLHIACKYEYPLVVEFLLARGVDANLRDGTGRTPIQTIAYLRGELRDSRDLRNIAEQLVRAGADLEILDEDGMGVRQTPLWKMYPSLDNSFDSNQAYAAGLSETAYRAASRPPRRVFESNLPTKARETQTPISTKVSSLTRVEGSPLPHGGKQKYAATGRPKIQDRNTKTSSWIDPRLDRTHRERNTISTTPAKDPVISSPLMRRISLTVVACDGLYGHLFRLPDPYASVTIDGKYKRTKTIKNARNPFWNETFTFRVDPDSVVKIEVYDHAKVKKLQGGFLGQTWVRLSELVPDDATAAQEGKLIPRQLKDQNFNKDCPGILLVRLSPIVSS